MPNPTGADARDNGRPPRDELVRAVRAGVEMRDTDEGGMPTLYGHFTVFNRWTEIDSFFEGHFLERIAPGAFKKTFREQTPKVLFQHGMDPQVGDKVLGRAEVLREESDGPYYEVPLLDTSYNRDLIPGLEADLYGASFRFSVIREEWVEEPDVSDDNPKGIPERTIKEARVSEFGPVTFPAYPDATAGVRSLTDEFILARATRDPERLRAMLDYLERREARPEEAPEEEPETEADRSAEDEAAPGDEPTPPAETAAPGGELTPLYVGSERRKAAPGAGPTPLYIPEHKRKGGWLK